MYKYFLRIASNVCCCQVAEEEVAGGWGDAYSYVFVFVLFEMMMDKSNTYECTSPEMTMMRILKFSFSYCSRWWWTRYKLENVHHPKWRWCIFWCVCFRIVREDEEQVEHIKMCIARDDIISRWCHIDHVISRWREYLSIRFRILWDDEIILRIWYSYVFVFIKFEMTNKSSSSLVSSLVSSSWDYEWTRCSSRDDLFIHKRDLCRHKRDLFIHTRDRCIHKRDLFIHTRDQCINSSSSLVWSLVSSLISSCWDDEWTRCSSRNDIISKWRECWYICFRIVWDDDISNHHDVFFL